MEPDATPMVADKEGGIAGVAELSECAGSLGRETRVARTGEEVDAEAGAGDSN